MKIIKPDDLALLYRTLRFERRNLLSIGMMALFDLEASATDVLGTEADLWQLAADALGKNATLDLGLPKPRGEWLAYGAAYAPDGVPAPLVSVQIAVGASRKTLTVHGERRFGLLGAVSAGRPFIRMPIVPPDLVTGTEAPASAQSPPNVEVPDAPVLERSDRRTQAGFFALPASSPERTRMLGPFDAQWLAADWPHLPLGTSVDYFATAPRDQRIDGFWRGDEAIEIAHMHPSIEWLRARLPGLRARCFVNRRTGDTERFEECLSRPETVWLFPELGHGIVLYRAVAAIDDEDGDDVRNVLAAWERLDAAPLPAEHYREQMRNEIAPAPAAAAIDAPESRAPLVDVGGAAPTPASPAAPVAATAAALAPAAATDTPDFSEIEKMSAELQAQTNALMKQHGLSAQDLERYMTPETNGTTASGNPGDDLAHMLQELESVTADMMKKFNVSEADVAKLTATGEAQAAPVSIDALGEQLREMHAEMQRAVAASGKTPAELAATLSDPEMAAAVRETANLDIEELVASLQRLGSVIAPAAASAVPDAAAATPPSAPPVPAQLTREAVLARVAAGESLRGLDLSGLDLSGAMLQGVDFSNALLIDTGLKGSRLDGANLAGAQASGADFSGASLQGASLSGASARGANFAQVDLSRASLGDGNFADTDFTGASLQGASCSKAIFTGSRMAGVRGNGCAAEQASFEGCDLRGADLSEAGLTDAVFDQATLVEANLKGARAANLRLFATQAAGAHFDGADLSGSRAGLAADFSGASFTHARLAAASWLDVDLRQAAFDSAFLERANFSGANATGARFVGAHAKTMQLAKADLTGADLSRANLMNATLRRARLDGALLRQANLYNAQCYGSTIGRAQLDGANVDRTVLDIPGRAEAQA